MVDIALIAVCAAADLVIPLGFFVFLLIVLVGLRYVEIQFPFFELFRKLRRQEEDENTRVERELRRIRLRVLRRSAEKKDEESDPADHRENEFFCRGSTTRYPSNPKTGYRGMLTKIPAATVACKECGGKGRIEVIIRGEKWEEGGVRSFPCNKCRGNGFLPTG